MSGKPRTDFLFAAPSLLSGAARCLDLGAVFDQYNNSATPEEADAWALLNDSQMLREAWGEYFQQTVNEDPEVRAVLEEVA